MKERVREFHLFAGIGGGIYGGELHRHECCAEIGSRRQKSRAMMTKGEILTFS